MMLPRTEGQTGNPETRQAAAYEAFLDAARDPMVLVDASGRIVDASPATTKMTGYSLEELRETDPALLFCQTTAHEEESFWSHLTRDDRSQGSLNIQKADGSVLSVAYRALGNVVPGRHLLVLRSHSEPAPASEARAYLAAIVESSDDAIVSKNLEGIIQSWNRGAERVFGYKAEEAIGKSILMLLPDERKGEEAEILAKIARGERIDHFETVRVRKDGRRIYISVTISPIKNERGQIVGASKVARDITYRKRTELAMSFLSRASEQLGKSLDYRETLSNVAHTAVPDFADWCAIDLLGADGTLERVAVAHIDPAKVKWAKELARKWPPDLNAPRGLGKVLRTGSPELYPEITDELLQSGAQNAEHLRYLKEAEIGSAMLVPLTSGGKTAGVLTLISRHPHHYDDGGLDTAMELGRRAGMALDNARLYSEIRALNERLEHRVRERTAELEAANRELEGFTYSVSHDLRGPLRAIMATSMILREDYEQQLPDEARKELQRQAAAAKKMGDLIDDLLRLSRLSRQEIAREPLNLTAIAEELLAEKLPPKGKATVEPNLAVEADPKLAHLLMQNLIENAIKFVAPGTAPIIEIGRTPAGEFFVKDQGVGFDSRYSDKIFMPFERLHRDVEFPGTGIGLANVKRIVERHGGKVRAESQGPGHGATFYFTLGPSA